MQALLTVMRHAPAVDSQLLVPDLQFLSRLRAMHTTRRASMDVGTSLLMLGILAAIVLSSYWDRLPLWLAISAGILLALLSLLGFADLFYGFKGMGHNALEQERQQKRHSDDDHDQSGSGAASS